MSLFSPFSVFNRVIFLLKMYFSDPCATIKCGYGADCVVDKVSKKGKCECSKTCSNSTKEVCGSNGKTYGNKCHLQIESCILQKAITVKNEGKCIGKYFCI